jgi:hypothetical protein
MSTVGLLESAWLDFHYGARLLRLNRGFFIVASLSLALGIGANTAIFQLLDAVRLRMLPISHPEQLAELRTVTSQNATICGWPLSDVSSPAGR